MVPGCILIICLSNSLLCTCVNTAETVHLVQFNKVWWLSRTCVFVASKIWKKKGKKNQIMKYKSVSLLSHHLILYMDQGMPKKYKQTQKIAIWTWTESYYTMNPFYVLWFKRNRKEGQRTIGMGGITITQPKCLPVLDEKLRAFAFPSLSYAHHS